MKKVALATLAATTLSFAAFAQSPPTTVTFQLVPNPQFLACLAQPGGPTPTATVTVVRGGIHETLQWTGANFRPNLDFDLFTVQNSQLKSDGSADPNFKNFGLAWYQSDIVSHSDGKSDAQLKTILLDQIFGFDPVVNLPPTNTYHMGLWFNNPQDAAACGFDVTKPTPFNGEHNAGPNAMITLPSATTGLGPLCSQIVSKGVCKI